MSTYTTRVRPNSSTFIAPIPLKRFFSRLRPKRGAFFGVMIFLALISFETFNYGTTEFALSDLLSDLRFLGIRWATLLALAFCVMDFAGIARLFTPERGKQEALEVWYLLGAWVLAATMNALLTWWAVSLALLHHQGLGNELIAREQLLGSVPVFVAVLVWLIRVLMIGTVTLSGARLFTQDENPRQASPPIRPSQSNRSSPSKKEMAMAHAAESARASEQRMSFRLKP